MASRRKKRMTIHLWNKTTVLDLGEIEIWDGADLALLRDTLSEQVESEGVRRLGVNMQFVKYIPSGFFGMLYDWQEKGIEIRLFSPQPNVAEMLWFRQFFDLTEDGSYLLQSEPKEDMVATEPVAEVPDEWADLSEWEEVHGRSLSRSSR
ncbi:STAS domain-containing protein [Thalassoroseus pseudoceratinae]|uniref:STAS domain-containing protein n=1 Tax=Thalassoroseus pseudoceratinae TaxID=2713176 RepID=UPI00141FEAEF|nr:hypothetical protein [Thalassoroseus pseudoceratinae]